MAKPFRPAPRPQLRPGSASILYWLVGAFIVLGGIYLLLTRKRLSGAEGFAAGKVTVSYYYLTECPWCNKFKPEWEKFKAEAAKHGIATAEFDGEKNQELVKQKNIKGFPSIWIQDTEYSGERTAEALLKAAKAVA